MPDLKEKFDTIFKHVQACGEPTENWMGVSGKLVRFGRKEVTAISLGTSRILDIGVSGRLYCSACYMDGKVKVDIGHEDGIHMIYLEVLKLPI